MTTSRQAWLVSCYLGVLLLHGVHVLEEALTGFGMIQTLGFGPWLAGNLALLAVSTLPGWYRLASGAFPLPWLALYAGVMTLNGVIHVGTALVQRAYDPGCASGALLVPVAGYLLLLTLRERRSG